MQAVGTALDAQRHLSLNTPDLILMDFRLPDSDGIVLTRELKDKPASQGIPVIMLTGQTEKQVIVESRRAGAVDFVAKPSNRDLLLKKVAQHLPH